MCLLWNEQYFQSSIKPSLTAPGKCFEELLGVDECDLEKWQHMNEIEVEPLMLQEVEETVEGLRRNNLQN